MLSKLTNYLLSNHIGYKMDIKQKIIHIDTEDISLLQADTIKVYCGDPIRIGRDTITYKLDPILFEI